jgi:hypothetical protein
MTSCWGKYDIHMSLALGLPALQLSVVSVHKSLINYHAVMHDPLKGTAVASLSFAHCCLLLTALTLLVTFPMAGYTVGLHTAPAESKGDTMFSYLSYVLYSVKS